MKKVFILAAAGLLSAGAFGQVVRNAFLPNGAEFTCSFSAGGKSVEVEMVAVEGSDAVEDFYIGKYEVTQGQWRAVMGPFTQAQVYGAGANYPVYYISWNDAQAFIDSLNIMAGGGRFRLPTDAEWEYAARGGSTPQPENWRYVGSNDLDSVGWNKHHSKLGGQKSHPVGELKANSIGVYDMSGNVVEWCEDCYYFGSDCSHRVLRGGSWNSVAARCAVSHRYYYSPDNRYYFSGFRLACSPN
jgi:formylglycine-generating enzyme required for sulfatase activity